MIFNLVITFSNTPILTKLCFSHYWCVWYTLHLVICVLHRQLMLSPFSTVMYLQTNAGGITIFGWTVDRALLNTIFFIELSLVTFVLGKTIVFTSKWQISTTLWFLPWSFLHDIGTRKSMSLQTLFISTFRWYLPWLTTYRKFD